MERAESDKIGHFEIDAVFNGKPLEPLEEIMRTGLKGAGDNTCKEVRCSLKF